jgi:general secretion pathway protein J
LSGKVNTRGLTLLEVLVAVSILALVSTLIYGAFDGMSRAQTSISRIDERYHQGRQALARMSRELQSAFLSTHQPLQLAASVRTTVFVGTDSGSNDRIDFVSFSHQRLMRNAHESDQNELSYFLARDPDGQDKQDLVRREQKEIDLEPTRGGIVSILAEDALAFDVSYLDPTTGIWTDSWDTTQAAGQYNRLPFEIRIRLVLRGTDPNRPLRLMTKVSMPMQAAINLVK